MPTYEYRCPNDHTFERFQRMSDPAPAACEICGASPVELVLYPVAVHYKGSGFYSTDYGKRKQRKSETGAGESASSDSAGEAKKGDAAPEKKKAAEAK